MKKKLPRRKYYLIVGSDRNFVHGAFYERNKAYEYKKKLEGRFGQKFKIVTK